jgi:hypothetical protein
VKNGIVTIGFLTSEVADLAASQYFVIIPAPNKHTFFFTCCWSPLFTGSHWVLYSISAHFHYYDVHQFIWKMKTVTDLHPSLLQNLLTTHDRGEGWCRMSMRHVLYLHYMYWTFGVWSRIIAIWHIQNVSLSESEYWHFPLYFCSHENHCHFS